MLGKGFGGSGNTNFIPLEIAVQSFTDAIDSARREAKIEHLQVECVVVGTEPDPAPVAPLITQLTNSPRILHKKEGECSMVGGLVAKVVLSLICGTGSVGWGRNARGETSMTSCWGPIGDEGFAYDIARRGVNAAFWGMGRARPAHPAGGDAAGDVRADGFARSVHPAVYQPELAQGFCQPVPGSFPRPPTGTTRWPSRFFAMAPGRSRIC